MQELHVTDPQSGGECDGAVVETLKAIDNESAEAHRNR
jgi:hypothetical protein